MGKPKVLELTEVERLALEKGFRLGEKHCFRMRCRAVLLKADGLSSAAAGVQTEMSQVSVNAWVKRFKSEGIDGLNTRSGRVSARQRTGTAFIYGQQGKTADQSKAPD